jgi:transcription elongation factor
MNKLAVILSLLAASSLVACKKKEGDTTASGSSGSGATKPTDNSAPDKPAPSGPFGAWDMDGRKAAFQGAHVAPGGGLGSWEAWNVEGDKVTIWDGTKESVAELSLTSPCEATMMVKSADGSSSGTTSHYTIEGGKIVSGLGDAGSRNGATAVACVSNKVVTLDASGACLEWEQDMFEKTKYKSGPGKCGFAKNGDTEVFKATVNGSEAELEIHGDAMYSHQIATTHSEKATDWAAAKAARDAKK